MSSPHLSLEVIILLLQLADVLLTLVLHKEQLFPLLLECANGHISLTLMGV